MLKKIILSTLLLYSFFSIAIDADFSGKVRVRTDASDLTNLTMETLDSTVKGIAVMSRINASVRPSEAFEADLSIFTNFAQEKYPTINYASSGRWMLSDEIMLKAGRSTYQIANGEVISRHDYQYVPNLFNMVALFGSLNDLDFDIGILSLNSGSETSTEGSLGLISVDVGSLPDILKSLNVHAIAPLSELSSVRLGATVGFEQMGVKGSVTVAHSNVLTKGDLKEELLADVMLKYVHQLNRNSVAIYGGLHFNGSNYDSLFYDEFKFSGMLNYKNWSSESLYASLGAKYMMGDCKVGATAYYFQTDGSIEVDAYLKKKMGDSSIKLWAGLATDAKNNYTSKAEASIMTTF